MPQQTRANSAEGRLYHGTASVKERVQHMGLVARKEAPEFLLGFIPSLGWLPKYRMGWLSGDLIAGVTVGVMVVPQALAFATLANLPVQYGLYTVFLAVFIYAFTGTSREVAVGPAAVISLLVGELVHEVRLEHSEFSPAEIIASANFLIAIATLTLGSLRLGFLMDLIPNPVIMGFTTGTAFIIMTTQIAGLFGVPGVVSSDPTITVLTKFFTNLARFRWHDMLIGLCSFAMIVFFNMAAAMLSKRYPLIRFLRTSANAITVILFTTLSFIVSKVAPEFTINMVMDVPAGLPAPSLPNLSGELVKSIWTRSIPILVIGVMEHVSICKAFARKSGYQISSSQELFSVGIANIFVSTFGGYFAVGSFPTSAVNSMSGVRTPLGGIVTGFVVILAMQFMTPAFYYIPKATLSAIIIFAAIHLIVGPRVLVDLWKVQPMDLVVFSVAAILTFFCGAEYGIGASIGLSFLVLLYRIARPRFYLLEQVVGRSDVFVDNRHPNYETTTPIPGVIVFRLQESLVFPNIDYVRDSIMDCCLEMTRSGAPPQAPQDQLWSDDLGLRGEKLRNRRSRLSGVPPPETSSLPLLRGVVFDFGSVNTLDSSGLQGLFDLRDTLLRYAGVSDNLGADDEDDAFNASLTGVEEGTKPEPYNPPAFEMHFVSTHPGVLKVLELSGITNPVAPIIPAEIRARLEGALGTLGDNSGTQQRQRNYHHTIEPIIANPSRYVHLTIADALKRIRRNFDRRNGKTNSTVPNFATNLYTPHTPQPPPTFTLNSPDFEYVKPIPSSQNPPMLSLDSISPGIANFTPMPSMPVTPEHKRSPLEASHLPENFSPETVSTADFGPPSSNSNPAVSSARNLASQSPPLPTDPSIEVVGLTSSNIEITDPTQLATPTSTPLPPSPK